MVRRQRTFGPLKCSNMEREMGTVSHKVRTPNTQMSNNKVFLISTGSHRLPKQRTSTAISWLKRGTSHRSSRCSLWFWWWWPPTREPVYWIQKLRAGLPSIYFTWWGIANIATRSLIRTTMARPVWNAVMTRRVVPTPQILPSNVRCINQLSSYPFWLLFRN